MCIRFGNFLLHTVKKPFERKGGKVTDRVQVVGVPLAEQGETVGEKVSGQEHGVEDHQEDQEPGIDKSSV